MTESKANIDALDLMMAEIVSWNQDFPLRWSPELTEILRDPAMFKTYIPTHVLVWGNSPELAKTKAPEPVLKN